jgi:hypothetical protein
VGAGWFRGGWRPGAGRALPYSRPYRPQSLAGRNPTLLHYCRTRSWRGACWKSSLRSPCGFRSSPPRQCQLPMQPPCGFRSGTSIARDPPTADLRRWWPTDLRVPSALLARHFHCSLSWSLLCNPPSRRSSRRATAACPHAITPATPFPPPGPHPSSASLRSRAAVLIGHWSRSSRWPFESDKATKKRRGSSIQSSI